MSYRGPTMHAIVPGEPEDVHESTKVFPPIPPPKLYDAPSMGRVKAFMVDEDEVDQLRITAIRRCTQVLADLAKLAQEPAMMSDVLKGQAALQRLRLERIDFAAAEAIERAMDRLESVLGSDAQVLDPRPEFGGYISLAAAREQVVGLTAAMKDYRAAREQLK